MAHSWQLWQCGSVEHTRCGRAEARPKSGPKSVLAYYSTNVTFEDYSLAVARLVAGQSLDIERLSKESREQKARHQQDLEQLQASLQAMHVQVERQFVKRDQAQQEHRQDLECTKTAGVCRSCVNRGTGHTDTTSSKA